ncbi:hypothetical protein DOY81_015341 [Sarcophaga bullata]|nr:hypothetical protein DOY81_015341 [Sarcophaga bullata]
MPQENEGVAKETCDKEQQFTVEKIVSRRVRKGRVEYLTKWQGFEEPENTWEPAESLFFCIEMIKKYEENRHLHNKTKATRASLSLTRSGRRHFPETTAEESREACENIQMPKKRGRKSHKELLEKEQLLKKTVNNKIKTYLKENNKTTVRTAAAANVNKPKLKDNEVASVVSITSTEDTKTADNDSKALKSSSATWQLNGTKFVSDFLTRQPAPKTGFEKGLLPEEILGAAEFKGNLYLVIKFRGDDEPHMVHNEWLTKKYPNGH